MAINFYQVKKKIHGKEYTAQFNGISAALKAFDNSYIDGTSNTSLMKLADYLFSHVIVSPAGLTVDDFDNMEEFNEVVAFAREVMQGNFRQAPDGKATEEKSE
jgi:hypothetical protein